MSDGNRSDEQPPEGEGVADAPPPPSTWQQWRKRLAPIALVIAVATLLGRDCSTRAVDVSVTVVLTDSGTRLEEVSAIDIEVLPVSGDSAEGWWRARYPSGWAPAKVSFASKVVAGDKRVVIDLTWRDGERIQLERRATVSDGAAIRIDLSESLRRESGAPALTP